MTPRAERFEAGVLLHLAFEVLELAAKADRGNEPNRRFISEEYRNQGSLSKSHSKLRKPLFLGRPN